jgi:hypothetical protein
MASSGQNSAMSRGEGRGIVSAEANFGKPSRGELEAMARRRFQDPAPKREGNWWCLLYWVDTFSDGTSTRKRKRHKLAPGDIPEREAKKMAAEFLRPMNQGLVPSVQQQSSRNTWKQSTNRLCCHCWRTVPETDTRESSRTISCRRSDRSACAISRP